MMLKTKTSTLPDGEGTAMLKTKILTLPDGEDTAMPKTKAGNAPPHYKKSKQQNQVKNNLKTKKQ